MRYLVEFRLPSDSHKESSLKEIESLPERSVEDQENDDERTSREGCVRSKGVLLKSTHF